MSTTPPPARRRWPDRGRGRTGSGARDWLLAVVGGALLVVLVGRPAMSLRPTRASNTPPTKPTVRRTLTVTVSATGNLQPTNQVDVGSEVSGLVETVFVDDNDRSRRGRSWPGSTCRSSKTSVINAKAALASAEARRCSRPRPGRKRRANLNTPAPGVTSCPAAKCRPRPSWKPPRPRLTALRADEASARAAVDQARASLSSA